MQMTGSTSTPMGRQSIKCGVTSCYYNEQGRQCTLDAIQVSASAGGNDGTPDGESMCASYRAK